MTGPGRDFCERCGCEVEWLTPQTVSEKTGASSRSVQNWVRQGWAHSWKLPNGRWLVCSRSLREGWEQRTGGLVQPLSHVDVKDQRIRRAIRLLQVNVGERLLVQEVAKEVGLSVVHFEYLFKKEVGTSFKRCQRKAKVDKAKQLLADMNLNITEVAFRLGYKELSHFERNFKRETGITPRTYQRKLS